MAIILCALRASWVNLLVFCACPTSSGWQWPANVSPSACGYFITWDSSVTYYRKLTFLSSKDVFLTTKISAEVLDCHRETDTFSLYKVNVRFGVKTGFLNRWKTIWCLSHCSSRSDSTKINSAIRCITVCSYNNESVCKVCGKFHENPLEYASKHFPRCMKSLHKDHAPKFSTLRHLSLTQQ